MDTIEKHVNGWTVTELGSEPAPGCWAITPTDADLEPVLPTHFAHERADGKVEARWQLASPWPQHRPSGFRAALRRLFRPDPPPEPDPDEVESAAVWVAGVRVTRPDGTAFGAVLPGAAPNLLAGDTLTIGIPTEVRAEL